MTVEECRETLIPNADNFYGQFDRQPTMEKWKKWSETVNGNISDVLRQINDSVDVNESDVDNGLEMGRDFVIDRLRDDNRNMAAQIETLKWVVRELIGSNTGVR